MEGYADDYYRWDDGWIVIVMDGVKYRTHAANVIIIEDFNA
jgi:hypothetical protein